MTRKEDLPVMPFASQGAWDDWLAAHHDTVEGVWLKLAKKDSGFDSVGYAEAVRAALCYGWIDSQKASVDRDFYLQRFTPRRSRSKWSRLMREAAAELIESAKMKDAGLAEVERAKADGRWDAAYDPPSTAAVPEDLQRRLDSEPAARRFFGKLDSRNRYAILHRIQTAKRPDTRARRIEKFVDMLRAGETIHPPRQSKQ